MAYFPPPLPSEFSTRAELLTSLPADNSSDRYLPVELHDLQTIIAENRKHASITGEASLVGEGEVLSYLWIAAVAYEQEGRVVGVRLWKAEQSCSSAIPDYPMGVSPTPGDASVPEPLPAGLPAECLAFQFSIFSLGPDIERVEVYAETRP